MVKNLTLFFGMVFILIGILGFVDNPLVGDIGIFMTNAAHDVIHILIGIVAIIAARGGWGTAFLKVFGAVYLLVALLGFWMGSPVLGFIGTNDADNWLHIALGAVFLCTGFMGGKKPMMPM